MTNTTYEKLISAADVCLHGSALASVLGMVAVSAYKGFCDSQNIPTNNTHLMYTAGISMIPQTFWTGLVGFGLGKMCGSRDPEGKAPYILGGIGVGVGVAASGLEALVGYGIGATVGTLLK